MLGRRFRARHVVGKWPTIRGDSFRAVPSGATETHVPGPMDVVGAADLVGVLLMPPMLTERRGAVTCPGKAKISGARSRWLGDAFVEAFRTDVVAWLRRPVAGCCAVVPPSSPRRAPWAPSWHSTSTSWSPRGSVRCVLCLEGSIGAHARLCRRIRAQAPPRPLGQCLVKNIGPAPALVVGPIGHDAPHD